MDNFKEIVTTMLTFAGAIFPSLLSNKFTNQKSLSTETEKAIVEYYDPLYGYLIEQNLNKTRNYKEISNRILQSSQNCNSVISAKLREYISMFYANSFNEQTTECDYIKFFFNFQTEYFAVIDSLPENSMRKNTRFTGFAKFIQYLQRYITILAYIFLFFSIFVLIMFYFFTSPENQILDYLDWLTIALINTCIAVYVITFAYLILYLFSKDIRHQMVYVSEDGTVEIYYKNKVYNFFHNNIRKIKIKYCHQAKTFRNTTNECKCTSENECKQSSSIKSFILYKINSHFKNATFNKNETESNEEHEPHSK